MDTQKKEEQEEGFRSRSSHTIIEVLSTVKKLRPYVV
jgi:hypothetical protein